MQESTFSTPKTCYILILLLIAGTGHAESWESFQIATTGEGTSAKNAKVSLVDISTDASVVVGNVVGPVGKGFNAGAAEFRYLHPYFWMDGMRKIQEITPNTDEITQYPNGYYGRVTGVSADGKWVIGEYLTAHENGFHQAFLYSIENDTFEYLGDYGWSQFGTPTPGTDEYLASVALDISGDGSTVVGWARRATEDGTKQGFIWTRETGMQKLSGNFIGRAFTCSRIMAISPDGAYIAGEASVYPFDGGSWETVFFQRDMERRKYTALHVPFGYTVAEISGIRGPDHAILGSIKFAGESASANQFDEDVMEQFGIRWDVQQDTLEIFADDQHDGPLAITSQSNDGRIVTLEKLPEYSFEGSNRYGRLWTPESGIVYPLPYLENRYEIEFDNLGDYWTIGRMLPSEDGSMLVFEVFTQDGKAIMRIDFAEPIPPLLAIFPDSSIRSGQFGSRKTILGNMDDEYFPYVYWDKHGWIYMDPMSHAETGIYIWHQSLGWCVLYYYQYGRRLYCYDSNEWIYIDYASSWMYSDSRGWFRMED